ncbi:MAG: hypothetical protein H6502_00060 [Candidatus Woesearchaeota archaeon]|nr:MAG: hypothetical protein H6502_00060 [Candidatus Woesearchaeota archaeon]
MSIDRFIPAEQLYRFDPSHVEVPRNQYDHLIFRLVTYAQLHAERGVELVPLNGEHGFALEVPIVLGKSDRLTLATVLAASPEATSAFFSIEEQDASPINPDGLYRLLEELKRTHE